MIACSHLYGAPRVTLAYRHHHGLHSALIEISSGGLSSGHLKQELIRRNILGSALITALPMFADDGPEQTFELVNTLTLDIRRLHKETVGTSLELSSPASSCTIAG